MDENAYVIQHKIDDGAFGEVLCVKDTKTNKIVAMKQILYRGEISNDPFIMNEIYSLSHLNHKNIVKLLDVIITDKSVNLIMELAENGNLETFIHSSLLAVDQLSQIFFQLLSAVDFCHLNRIAHRDITPCNILLTNKTSVRLADFGLSVPCRDSEGQVILCDDYLGHFHYSAPEVLKRTPYDPLLSDMWSVGIVLYFMVNADVPFKGDEEDIVFQQTNDNIVTDLINRENEKGKRCFGHYNIVLRNVLRGQPERRCRTGGLIQVINNET